MSPEYGATCGFFPVDDETLRYLRLTGRSEERLALVEAYCKENGLWHDAGEQPDVLAGRRARPLDRRAVARRPAPPAGPGAAARTRKRSFLEALPTFGVDYGNGTTRRSPSRSRRATRRPSARPGTAPRRDGVDVPAVAVAARPGRCTVELDGETFELDHGAVVIAAITSCTNTSNPAVMVAAGLLAKKAVERGLHAPAVGEVVPRAGLEGRHRVLRQGRADAVPRGARLPHRRLRLHDLHRQLRPAARRRSRAAIDGGRPRRLRGPLRQPQLRGAHPRRGEGELPRLAAARRRLRARRTDGHRPRDRAARPGPDGERRLPRRHLALTGRGGGDDRGRARARRCSATTYADVFTGDPAWRELPVPAGRSLRVGATDSTYVRRPPYFDGMSAEPGTRRTTSHGARCLVAIGDSVTTDHISPAGSIKPDSPGRRVPRRARRRARGLQLLRLAARQPRGDGARHVRERAAAQPARARLRGDVDGAPARRARRRRSSRPRSATSPRACR